MNHQEAKELKEKYGKSKFFEIDVEMDIYVAPNLRKDFENFCGYYSAHKITDDTALNFSNNQKYELYGFYYRQGVLLYKYLTEIILEETK